MRFNTYRDMAAARSAFRTPETRFISVTIGRSYVHKGIVAFRDFNQAIMGYVGDEPANFEEIYLQFAANVEQSEEGPDSMTRTSEPFNPGNPFAALSDPLGPFAPDSGHESDPRRTTNPETMRVWNTIYMTDCHPDCEDKWTNYFSVAIYEVAPSDVVSAILSDPLDEGDES